MGGMSWIHWLLVAGVVLLFFGGRGKLSEFMGDAAKGIKAFKKGLAEDETTDKSRIVHEAEVVHAPKEEKVPH